MAGKYLDLEVKWLREDLDFEVKYLREDLERETEYLWGSIRQIQDLVGIERKDGLTIEELVRYDIYEAEAILKRLKKKR